MRHGRKTKAARSALAAAGLQSPRAHADTGAEPVAQLDGRPLRVLAYNSLFPLLPETYIGDEMHVLTAHGAQLAWYTLTWAPSPVTLREPLYTDIDAAIDAVDPDVLVLFWADFAVDSLPALERIGRPFAVRMHSYDFDVARGERLLSHPLCVGLWAYPHHAVQIDGAHPLPPLLASWDEFPEPAAERPVVLLASAALPKKNWPVLVDAFAQLVAKGADCRIAVARTRNHEGQPDLLRDLIADAGAQIKLSVDVPHDQVVELLARTSVVLYTKVDHGPYGMPRSIIEGMAARTSVVQPDRPEASLVAGPGCRTYVTADDIVAHVAEVLAGGDAIAQEQARNRAFAEAHYADPRTAARFAAELTEAVARHRGA
jgi:glycosyltransferase involved in cell wall biosynthesis